ncbi:MAG: universal stress protein [Candidatus Sericytochromatia bacterium]|nr:universal stress protein [Candidatus Sericytochromatia bacterium]
MQAECEGPITVAVRRGPFVETALATTRILMAAQQADATLIHAAADAIAPAEVAARLGIAEPALAGFTVLPVRGEPTEAILRAGLSLQARLIVLSLPEGHDGLGETREQVLAQAPCPLLFVPSRMARPLGARGRLLLPMDGTPTTSAVFPLAQVFARSLHLTIETLHVAAVGATYAEAGTMTVPRFVDRPHYDWPSWRREFTYRFCDCAASPGPHVPTQLHVLPGPPHDAILQRAAEHPPDLIVLGWRGSLAPGRALTLCGVLKASRWPVLVARMPDGAGPGEATDNAAPPC